jgi:hypothetical protein
VVEQSAEAQFKAISFGLKKTYKVSERIYLLPEGLGFISFRPLDEKKYEKHPLRTLRLCGENYPSRSKIAAIPKPPPPQMHSNP